MFSAYTIILSLIVQALSRTHTLNEDSIVSNQKKYWHRCYNRSIYKDPQAFDTDTDVQD